MADAHIRALTARHPIKPTSPRCPSAWQPNPGGGSTYRSGNSVQTTGTISMSTADEASKTKAKNELLAFIQDNMLVSNNQEWDVVSGLFDDGWTPAGWV